MECQFLSLGFLSYHIKMASIFYNDSIINHFKQCYIDRNELSENYLLGISTQYELSGNCCNILNFCRGDIEFYKFLLGSDVFKKYLILGLRVNDITSIPISNLYMIILGLSHLSISYEWIDIFFSYDLITDQSIKVALIELLTFKLYDLIKMCTLTIQTIDYKEMLISKIDYIIKKLQISP